MNQQFAKDAEAALASVESEKLSLLDWSRLLEMRASRLVALLKANAPKLVIEREVELIEKALEGVQREL